MPLNFDNRVSWMDIIAITAALLTGMTVFFGVSEDVATNSSQISVIQTDLRRIEVSSTRRDDKILQQLKENKVDMKEIRKESSEGRQDILNKLDRLIEREINHNNGHHND